MRTLSPNTITAGALALGLVWLAAGCKPKPAAAAAKPAVAAPKAKIVALTNDPSSLYASVFEELPSPKVRDPFFPDSHRRDPAPVRTVAQPGRLQPQGELHLKGLVSSSTHRQALINNTVLAEGEEDTVRVPDGVLHVRCLKIGADFAVVQVRGQNQPKRLVLEEKHY